MATAAQQFPAPSTESKRSRTRSREPDEAKERIDQEPELNMRKEEEDKIRNIKMAVEDEFAKVIPADSLKMIKKVSLELASKIEQLQKTNSRITQHEKDIESLKSCEARMRSQKLWRSATRTPRKHGFVGVEV